MSTSKMTLAFLVCFVPCVVAHPAAGIVVDAKGQVYFVHPMRSRIMRIDAARRLTTFVQGEDGKKLSVPHHLVLDKNGDLISVGDRDGVTWRISPDGKTTQFFPKPGQVGIGNLGSGGDPFTIDSQGNIIMVLSEQFQTSHIMKINSEGKLVRFVGDKWGFADGVGAQAKFRDLHGAGFAWTADGSLLLTDNGSALRRITADGTVTTLAGGANAGFADGAARQAQFNGAIGIAVDPAGNILIADTDNHRIRKLTPQGQVSTIAGSGQRGGVDGAALKATFDEPSGVALGRDGTIYILDFVGDHPRVRKMSADGNVATIATTN